MTKKLRSTQREAAHLIALGFEIYEILRKLKIRWSTLSRWRRQPEFVALLEAYTRDIQEHAEYRQELFINHLIESSKSIIVRQAARDEPDGKAVDAALHVFKHIQTCAKHAQTAPNLSKPAPNAPKPDPNLPKPVPNGS